MSSPLLVASLFFIFTCCYGNPMKAGFRCSNSELSDDLRKEFLNYHNDARLRVAKGVEPNNNGLLNSAKNMYKLEWDCSMEQMVQDSIRSCSSGLGSFPGMAQNLRSFKGSGSFDPSTMIQSSLDAWWGGAKRIGVTDPENKYNNEGLYSFANMVFAETTKLGCAYKICGNSMVITCLYNGLGYITNQPMWETGQACKKAADCTTYKNSGCEGGLCTKGPDVPETNKQCPANSGVTDSVRETYLSMHNNFRSSLARGLEADALGHGQNAPKAAKMLKMVYDCSIEASAVKHGNKCVYEHSAGSDRPGLGENIYMTTVVKFDKNKAAKEASQLWWNELKEYGIGPDNFLTPALFNRPKPVQIGHYTQMAWETSYKLGCAVVHCSNFTYGVCQYGPAGNYMNHLIYTIGEPCSQCATTCSPTEGLCSAT